MSYFRRGDLTGPAPLPSLDLAGYGDGDWPDPLAGDATRFGRLWDAWDAMVAARNKKQESAMGYYAAGGASGYGVLANQPAYPTGTQGLASIAALSAPASASSASSSSAAAGGAPRRRRTQVINLTALRRAERRIERAARVAHRLFSFKKQGVHGLKLKHHRRKSR